MSGAVHPCVDELCFCFEWSIRDIFGELYKIIACFFSNLRRLHALWRIVLKILLLKHVSKTRSRSCIELSLLLQHTGDAIHFACSICVCNGACHGELLNRRLNEFLFLWLPWSGLLFQQRLFNNFFCRN